MEISVIEAEGYVHFKPVGRIESATAGLFERALLAQLSERGRSVLVDLSEIDYVSSAGLRVFLLGAKKVKGTSVTMVLCAMDDKVRSVFAMSGFERILQIAENVDQGRQMLKG
jgi:anti-anti-sigma factor